MSKFDEIQAFTQIVESGSITAAAERLAVAKSAVSRRLAELEARLGVELFHRTTRKLTLTDSGHGFYERMVRILTDLQEAEDAVCQAHHELRGPLKIAAPLTFGLHHLGPAINDFIRAHPQIEATIDFNDRQVDVIQEGFDVAVRIAQLGDSSLIARRLAGITMVTCASPAYLRAHGTPATPEDLTAHQCLTYSYQDTPNMWRYRDQSGNDIEVRIHPHVEANNGDYLTSTAIAGHGIVRQPRFIAYEAIARGELVPILTDYVIPAVNAYAIYPPTRHLSQRVRAFVDFLVARYAGTPYWEA